MILRALLLRLRDTLPRFVVGATRRFVDFTLIVVCYRVPHLHTVTRYTWITLRTYTRTRCLRLFVWFARLVCVTQLRLVTFGRCVTVGCVDYALLRSPGWLRSWLRCDWLRTVTLRLVIDLRCTRPFDLRLFAFEPLFDFTFALRTLDARWALHYGFYTHVTLFAIAHLRYERCVC